MLMNNANNYHSLQRQISLRLNQDKTLNNKRVISAKNDFSSGRQLVM